MATRFLGIRAMSVHSMLRMPGGCSAAVFYVDQQLENLKRQAEGHHTPARRQVDPQDIPWPADLEVPEVRAIDGEPRVCCPDGEPLMVGTSGLYRAITGVAWRRRRVGETY